MRERIASGDVDALSVAFDRYGGLIYVLAGRCCSHRGHADDLTRSAFLALWKQPRQRPGWPLAAVLIAQLFENTPTARGWPQSS